MSDWPEPVQRVAQYLLAASAEARLEEFGSGTSTAADAARAIGCDLAQVVKSIVFQCEDATVVALVPGDRRADEAKVARAVGAPIARVARPSEVEAATGFQPGAVAPFPLPRVARVLVDSSLLAHECIWVGAGSPRHMAGLAPAELVRVARAQAMDTVQNRA